MKAVYIVMSMYILTFILSGCSKTPSEPYYDRAQQASQKAHNKLSKD